jgi:hypothetical protein
MSATQLLTPIVDGGIRSINFFNGRLLSARDLTLEQSAYREADRRLGKAIGDGIAYGLEVSKAANFNKDAPSVSVEAGLAINRLGQPLMLRARTDVALVPAANGNGTSAGFAECLPLQTGAYVAGAGVYLLTIAPMQTSEGRATTSAINPATTTCNTDTTVSAVQFRLIQIDSALTTAELQDQDHLRNVIAYKCFGVEDTRKFVADPFGTEIKEWGLLDDLRPNQLTDCEVPLAILHWTDADGIKFIDLWSVRRRLTSNSLDGRWDADLSDRRMSEGEAAFLQFQEQLSAIISQNAATLSTLKADRFFKHLPPAGFLPMVAGGLDYATFLGPYATALPISMGEGVMRAIVKRALLTGPAKINSFAEAEKFNGRPTPFDVFVTPDLNDFVLFARSEQSRIRVFLSPPPPKFDDLSIEAATDTTSETLIALAATANKWFEIPHASPANYFVDVTLPGFLKPALVSVNSVGGRTSDIQVTLAPLPRGSISVNVTDAKSPPTNINDKVLGVTATDSDGVVTVGVRGQNGQWVISNLLPDKYDVAVTATGFSAKTVQDIGVLANQTASIAIPLTAVTPTKPKPDDCVDTVVTAGRTKVTLHVCMKLKDMTVTKPTAKLVRAFPDDKGTKWLSDWQDFLDDQFQAAKVISQPQLLIDPSTALGGEEDTRFIREERIVRRTPFARETLFRRTGELEEREVTSARERLIDRAIIRKQQDGWAVFGNLYVPVNVDVK